MSVPEQRKDGIAIDLEASAQDGEGWLNRCVDGLAGGGLLIADIVHPHSVFYPKLPPPPIVKNSNLLGFRVIFIILPLALLHTRFAIIH